MAIRIVQVDAFTSRPFAGNPAAVCVFPKAPAGHPSEQWMRDVAREMNLSETAFLFQREGVPPDDGYNLRWFTPAVEVDLCGHATLASAHVLWEDGHLPEDRKSTRLNSSHLVISYAVFCLKNKRGQVVGFWLVFRELFSRGCVGWVGGA